MSDPSWYRPGQLPRWVGVDLRTLELPPNAWSPVDSERRIARELVEWLFVFDPAHGQIARFRGTEVDVDLSDEIKSRVGGPYGPPLLANCLLVHNHPPASADAGPVAFPPSPRDLTTVIELDVRRMVVVSHDMRYVLSRPGLHWPSDEGLMADIVSDIRGALDRDIGHEDPSLVGQLQRQALVLERLHQDGWIDYEHSRRTTGVR